MALRIDRTAILVVIGLAVWFTAMAAAEVGDVARGARVYLPEARDRADLLAYLRGAAQRLR